MSDFAHETMAERYDRLAAEFTRATGLTAPGKDVPAAMGSADDRADRMQAWTRWARERQDRLEADAARWRAVRDRLLGCDFAWGEPPAAVVCFTMPEGASVSANPDDYADACRAALAAAEGEGA